MRTSLKSSISFVALRLHVATSFEIRSNYLYKPKIKLPRSLLHSKELSTEVSCFHDEVASWLETSHIPFRDLSIISSPYNVIGLGNKGGVFDVGLHVIPTPNNLVRIQPDLCKKLTEDTTLPFKTIIHLHEDVWYNKKDIVQARLNAKVNRVKHRWFARKTTIKRINITTTMEFLVTNHLWGATRSKFNYGLFMDDELIAVATFSPRRHVQRGNSCRAYRSHELIRYCSVRDGHVIGGITKLIAGFCRDFAPDDIVTCIDRDWGDGGGWENIGFERVSVMPPLIMTVGDDGVRKYLVGAGIGTNNSTSKNDRNGRPGIGIEVYEDLNQITFETDAAECIDAHSLYPVYDAGVERRLLLIRKSKLESQTRILRQDLDLEDLGPSDQSLLELWADSSPSFPNEYYSKNSGINALLQGARNASESITYT